MQGGPVSLSKPWVTSLYTLGANCEWVLGMGLRKVCWISSVDLWRGNGGHFGAGLLLAVVREDGVEEVDL